MTIKLIGSGRSFFLLSDFGCSCLYSRLSDWSKYYRCVDTYNILGPRTRRDIECLGTCTFLFVKCFFFSFPSNKISPLTLDKQAPPFNRNKRRIEGQRKKKRKRFQFPLLTQISLQSVRNPFCPSVFFQLTPPNSFPFQHTPKLHIQPTSSLAYTPAPHQLPRRGKPTLRN